MDVEKRAIEITNNHSVPSCHSEFQIKNFIIGKEASDIGKLWQCVKEIQVRKENLDVLNVDLEETKDNLELAKYEKQEIELETNDEKGEMGKIFEAKKEIRIRKQQRKINKIEKSIETLLQQKENILFETGVFVQEFEEVSKNCVYKDYNDAQAQLQFWHSKFDSEIFFTKALGHPLSPELVKSCLALPSGSPLRQFLEQSLQIHTKKLIKENN